MKLTKYEHACFTLEKDGQFLVVDPGSLARDFIVPDRVVAIVVTHEHNDHFDPDQLAAVFDKNPDSILLADESIIAKMPDHKSQAVKPGDTVTVGPFNLEFFGGKHAVIHESVPVINNVGVLINDLVYYPGDSLVTPGKPVDVLAVPIGAPWLKTGEAMDFLGTIKPRFAFPTHDAVLSADGQLFNDNWMSQAAKTAGAEYKRINGQSLDI